MKFSNFFAEYFCGYEKIKTITFLNWIIFKNRSLENYAYAIKKYVLNIFQQRTKKKKLDVKKNLGGKSPVEWPIYYIL